MQSCGIVSGHSCHRPGRASRPRPARGSDLAACLAVSTLACSRLQVPCLAFRRFPGTVECPSRSDPAAKKAPSDACLLYELG